MKKTFVTISILFLLSLCVQGQVTIGSLEEPASGALLDLKNKKPATGENPLITADKALLYPRVLLEKIDNLLPIFDLTGQISTLKQIYKGTTVYNLTTTGDFSPITLGEGLYVWDGDRWIKLANEEETIFAQPYTTGKLPQTLSTYADIYSPNSYMVQAGQTIKIPVAKAYAMWHEYKLPSNAKYSAGKTLAEVESNNITGTGTVELVWQDVNNLLTLSNITLEGTGRDAKISVATTAGRTGNAVVSIKYNNVVRWSWHVWITDYNPQSTNVTLSSLGYPMTMMDRNLGATSNDKTINSQGLFYQWGRKDPFPNSKSYNQLATETTSYDITGAAKSKTVTTVNQSVNLVNSIKNPFTFYTCVTSGPNISMDWYSSEPLSDVRETIQNDYLWDEYGMKSPFDPCPQGWRVAPERYGLSPWNYVTTNSSADPSYLTSYGGVADNFTSNFGVTFNSLPNYTIGYYPCAGDINGETGNFENVGGSTTIWTATPDELVNSESNSLKIGQISINTQEPNERSKGAAVRCITDN